MITVCFETKTFEGLRPKQDENFKVLRPRQRPRQSETESRLKPVFIQTRRRTSVPRPRLWGVETRARPKLGETK